MPELGDTIAVFGPQITSAGGGRISMNPPPVWAIEVTA